MAPRGASGAVPEQSQPGVSRVGSVPAQCIPSMACFRPRIMWKPPAETGGRYALSCRQAAAGSEPVPVPCGGCEGCDARRSADWCWRIGKEFEAVGRVGMFLTLTLEDDHLPDDFNISRDHYQGFLKRLRAFIDRSGGAGYADGVDRLRIAGCGEYGGRKGRPHYHLLVMGWKASDLEPDLPSKGGFPQWSSDRLTQLWGLGRVWVGEVTEQSISYVVGYFRKMQRGANAADFYRTVERFHPVTGERVIGQRPPFAIYSRGTKAKGGVRAGGLGMSWLVQDDGTVSPDAGHLTVRRPDPVVTFQASSLAGRPRIALPGEASGGRGAVVLRNVQATPRAVTRKWLESLSAAEREAAVDKRRAAAIARSAELEAKGETTIARTLTRELCAVLRMQGVMGVSERWPVERIREVEELIGLARGHPDFDLEALRELHAGTFELPLYLARREVDELERADLARAVEGERPRAVAATLGLEPLSDDELEARSVVGAARVEAMRVAFMEMMTGVWLMAAATRVRFGSAAEVGGHER